jgi:hypothetical protein
MPIDEGIESNKIIPFVYNFIPSVNDNWESQKASDNLSGIGFSIPAGQTREMPIAMDQDYNFLLTSVRYTVYYIGPLRDKYLWYDEALTSPTDWFMDPADGQAFIGNALIRDVRVSLSIHPAGRYLYGGPAKQSNTSTRYNGNLMLQPEALQGYDYGIGQVESGYYLPRSGIVTVSAHNTHAANTYVLGGALFGYKTAL